MYHITKNGEFAVCTATVRECPLGGPHGTKEELELALAETYESSVGLSKLPKDELYPLPPSEDFPERWDGYEREFYEPIKKHLGLHVFQGMGYVLGTPTESTFYCFDCYARLPKSDAYAESNWAVTCTCGRVVKDGLSGVTLKYGAEKFFHKKAVVAEEWYHYSSHEDWESFLAPENTEARVVHLGTKEAALDRRNHTTRAKGKLYKLRLKPEASVTDEILEDDPFNQAPPPLIREGGFQKGIHVEGVTRYVNYYEDPGSISLMVNPRLIEILAVETAPEKV